MRERKKKQIMGVVTCFRDVGKVVATATWERIIDGFTEVVTFEFGNE